MDGLDATNVLLARERDGAGYAASARSSSSQLMDRPNSRLINRGDVPTQPAAAHNSRGNIPSGVEVPPDRAVSP